MDIQDNPTHTQFVPVHALMAFSTATALLHSPDVINAQGSLYIFGEQLVGTGFTHVAVADNKDQGRSTSVGEFAENIVEGLWIPVECIGDVLESYQEDGLENIKQE